MHGDNNDENEDDDASLIDRRITSRQVKEKVKKMKVNDIKTKI